jgi:hypothetical protein
VRVISARESKIGIVAGLAGAALGVTFQWLAEYVSFRTSAVSLPELLAVLSLILTLGGMLAALLGAILFARREPFGRSFCLSLGLSAVALCSLYLLNFNIHNWTALLALTLFGCLLIAVVVFVIAFAVAPR